MPTSTPTSLAVIADEAERVARYSTDPTVHFSAQTIRYMAVVNGDDEDRLEVDARIARILPGARSRRRRGHDDEAAS